MQGLVLTGRQIAQLARLVDSDDDEVSITYAREGQQGCGLYASSTVRAGARPLFQPEPELPAGAIHPVSQPRR